MMPGAANSHTTERRNPGVESTAGAGLLPGCVRSIDLQPPPRWRVVLRNTRALHGVLTQVWGRPHDRREPNFLLMPWKGGCGWAAQWLVEGAESLPSRLDVNVFNGERRLLLGPPIRLKLPPLPVEDEYVLALETMTPVLIRHGGVTRTEVEASNIVSALCMSSVIERAIGGRADASRIQLSIVHQDTRPSKVHVGGGWGGCGIVVGWEGVLVMRANGYAKRLLDLAALVGIGGRGSLGFGRVRVRNLRP